MANTESVLYKIGQAVSDATVKVVNSESELPSTAKDGTLAIISADPPYMVFKLSSAWYPMGASSGVAGGETASEVETSNIFNISTRDTEENILLSTPTNPVDSVNIAFGTDTYDLYIWNGSSWSKYFNDT